ncbi:MAG: type II toxin-antitoxin system VapC family toxin [Prosthecobacter sp.]|uniref:type II toxin-antitoxin system VapC family toxin n=1 Tax=Prosthecobacter sp. TaxID=1965333 RepID=UPI0038FEB2F7
MLYFDTSYIARLYLEDHGCAEVRKLAATDAISTARHGRLETLAAFHRALRETRIEMAAYEQLRRQFENDCQAGGLHCFPLTAAVYQQAEAVFATASASVFLRAADALHLASAAQNGFAEIYSHDRHLLAAAPLFGLRGVNIIPAL